MKPLLIAIANQVLFYGVIQGRDWIDIAKFILCLSEKMFTCQ